MRPSLDQILQSSSILYSCWNLGVVKIGSKTDAVLTYMFENVLEVLDHQVNGGVSILTAVRAGVASSEVDADHTAGFTDRSQLLVGEISRMRAQSNSFVKPITRFSTHQKGLSFSVDQGGVSRDRECNVRYWRQKINAGTSAEQAHLLNGTFLTSRAHDQLGGFRQALIFEPGTTRILSVGSGNRIGIESTCIAPASAVF